MQLSACHLGTSRQDLLPKGNLLARASDLMPVPQNSRLSSLSITADIGLGAMHDCRPVHLWELCRVQTWTRTSAVARSGL